MKNIFKKWWFWAILGIVIIICVFVKHYIDNKNIENKFKDMGEGASSYYNEMKKSKGYNDKFVYNYQTGEVDYIQ